MCTYGLFNYLYGLTFSLRDKHEMYKFNRSLSAPLEDSQLDFEMLPHKSPVLKMTSFHAAHGNHAGPARLPASTRKLCHPSLASWSALTHSWLRGGSRGPEKAQQRGAMPTLSSCSKSNDSFHPFWGWIRCCLPTASKVPALAQSDIQVTLDEGNKTRPDEAGGSLLVVTGSTGVAFQIKESNK